MGSSVPMMFLMLSPFPSLYFFPRFCLSIGVFILFILILFLCREYEGMCRGGVRGMYVLHGFLYHSPSYFLRES